MIVLDFDGTLTDAEREGAPFVRGYLEDITRLVGQQPPHAATEAQAAAIERELRQAPEAHAFYWAGRAVAPATVDPYLRMALIAEQIFDAHGAFRHPPDREALLRSILYRYNYEKTSPVFRDGAAEFLASLPRETTHIVTNSATAHVRKKVETLDAGSGSVRWLAERVVGDAGKFVVDDNASHLPEHLTIPGLSRPILLRRAQYHRVLTGLLASAGESFGELIVVGDIFELDLAMPLALGARVVLVANDATPAYERAYVGAHPRGHVATDLAQVQALVAR